MDGKNLVSAPTKRTNINALPVLWICAGLTVCVYAGVAWLSQYFEYGVNLPGRPILPVLGLFTVAFVLHLVALWWGLRQPPTQGHLSLVLGFSLVYRLLLLASNPIQEVDLYRYLWDGAVGAAGISPFRYAPAELDGPTLAHTPSLARLAELRAARPGLAQAHQRIHYAHLPTVYPPVSQIVFIYVNVCTPASADLATRKVLLKAALLAFDLATLLLVQRLLRATGKHPAWAMVYGWCPLVIKEFANSGHLDTIAVFFTTAAVTVIVSSSIRPAARAACVGVCLGLGVGAKLFPVVLMPLLTIILVRRQGMRHAGVMVATFFLTTILVLAPMFASQTNSSTSGSLGGLREFFQRWEMNDWLFMLVLENCRPNDAHALTPWFVVMPATWRQPLGEWAREYELSPERFTFGLTRFITGIVFALIALGLTWRAYVGNPRTWLQAVFLTLAWFWLLAPTQNPWYWIWAMPFLPFAPGRAWLAMSGLTFIYYLRFWLQYHFPDTTVLATPYVGARFFDYVVVWIEFMPWFCWLFLEWWYKSNPQPIHG